MYKAELGPLFKIHYLGCQARQGSDMGRVVPTAGSLVVEKVCNKDLI